MNAIHNLHINEPNKNENYSNQKDKKRIHVVCAIICKGDEILVAQRSYGEFAGMWEFPGGKIEVGETKHEALHREIMEELSVRIDIEKLLTTITYEYPTFHLTMDCFLCTLPQGETLILQEHQAMKWLSRNTLDELNWIPADIEIVNLLRY